MGTLILISQILVFILSLILVGLVLVHKGSSGGVSDMFGGAIAATASSSGVAARNLNYITVGVAMAWTILIVMLGILMKFVG